MLPSQDASNKDPTAGSTSYITHVSIASLGVLLLELLFAQPIESKHELRALHLDKNGQPHNETDFLTARDWLPEVKGNGGPKYRDVVRACIKPDADNVDWNDPGFVSQMYEKVVEGLEEILRDMQWDR